ncbi:MAG TPA: Holliday junction branch migration protein RuvA [Candidatus Coprenecus pullistercoris]|nr:Holliday junction branch migration protein RuvA [Candidatus Coprenecus pullistercoris]
MYDYIKGSVEELNPAWAVIECGGIGYLMQISLYTYEKLRDCREARIFIHHHVREDEETLFGFFDKEERRIFTLLISVSGIGPNTARMVLSSLTPDEISAAVASGDVNRIKAVKGIGLKTAQKVIIELKDKIAKGSSQQIDLSGSGTGTDTAEACSALIMLGFTKNAVEKTVASIVRKEPGLSLEDIIKKALKIL